MAKNLKLIDSNDKIDLNSINANPSEKVISLIDGYANEIGNQLIEIRMYDVDRIKNLLFVVLKDAIKLSMLAYRNEVDDKRDKLIKDKEIYKAGFMRQKINSDLTAINNVKKKINTSLHIIQHWDEYMYLKLWLSEKYGEDFLKEWYEDQKNIIDKISDERIKQFNLNLIRQSK